MLLLLAIVENGDHENRELVYNIMSSKHGFSVINTITLRPELINKIIIY